MSNLVVIAFGDETGAKKMEAKLQDMQKEQIIEIDDAAVVVRDPNGKTHVDQMQNLAGAGALGGAFWGLLIGALFLVPWLGVAVGAVTGAFAGKNADVGIDSEFIKKVSNTIKPGNSALFIMANNAKFDRVVEELKPYGGEIIHTSLSSEQEAKMKAAFGGKHKTT
ncbi:DUF1269 domain-containing protein [Candidatus Roizmanbacteria bacterium]|nr:DUF1269 domain-containing protein [Candidatus Roizmanbacteria bacterium]